VSLTVETRPDWCDGRILPDLLDAGVTRVEIGVECLRDEVLIAVGRAHGVDEVVAATREARDRGLKVCYHLMLGLPGMDPEKDLADWTRLFADPDFRPDMVKIYPTLVLPGTPLYDDWRSGRYEPYDTPTAARLLAEEKATAPPWVRIQRIQRDIPSRLIAAGVRASNVRELALRELRRSGRSCRCLRCREVGRRASPEMANLELGETTYEAGGGQERFLAWEDPSTDAVAGFLRLRFPSDRTVGGLTAPVIRELKVLGPELPVGDAAGPASEYQHRGLGRSLVARAERSALERGYDRLYVTSAVGSRGYFERLGFARERPYMAKRLFS
jgi:elongator complex protein 3